MSNTVIDRLQECINLIGSNNALALKVGISEGTIRRILSGGKPKERTLKAIADSLEISSEWLIEGTGEMKVSSDEQRRFLTAIKRAYDELEGSENLSIERLAKRAYDIFKDN